MKIKVWSYKEPQNIISTKCFLAKVSNMRVAEFEPEFGILEQCWVYIFELEIIEKKEADMFINNDGVVCDDCNGCIFASKNGCQKPSYISDCWKDKGDKNG